QRRRGLCARQRGRKTAHQFRRQTPRGHQRHLPRFSGRVVHGRRPQSRWRFRDLERGQIRRRRKTGSPARALSGQQPVLAGLGRGNFCPRPRQDHGRSAVERRQVRPGDRRGLGIDPAVPRGESETFRNNRRAAFDGERPAAQTRGSLSQGCSRQYQGHCLGGHRRCRSRRTCWRSGCEIAGDNDVITIKNKKNGQGLKQAVEEISGVDISICFQCKKCSSGCPVAKLTKSRPSEIMRWLHLGAGDELLSSDLVWMCASCETCSARCPMGIDVAAVMDALRRLAIERGAPKPEGNVPLFNRAFLKTVETFGRSYEIGMITAYKLGTGKLMNDTEKFPAMLKKRKIALLPPRGGDRKIVKRIFKAYKQNKGAKACDTPIIPDARLNPRPVICTSPFWRSPRRWELIWLNPKAGPAAAPPPGTRPTASWPCPFPPLTFPRSRT